MEFLSLSRRRSSARNVPISEERGETDVFAGYVGGAQVGSGARARSARRARGGNFFSFLSSRGCRVSHVSPKTRLNAPNNALCAGHLWWWLIITTESTPPTANLLAVLDIGFQIAQTLWKLRTCHRFPAHTTRSGLVYRSLLLECRSASQ